MHWCQVLTFLFTFKRLKMMFLEQTIKLWKSFWKAERPSVSNHWLVSSHSAVIHQCSAAYSDVISTTLLIAMKEISQHWIKSHRHTTHLALVSSSALRPADRSSPSTWAVQVVMAQGRILLYLAQPSDGWQARELLYSLVVISAW